MNRPPRSGMLPLVIGVVILGLTMAAAVASEREPTPAPQLGASDPPVELRSGDVDRAVEMLVTADHGGRIGHSIRWAGPQVTYSVEANAEWTPEFGAAVRNALGWAAGASGLSFVEVSPAVPSQLVITSRPSPGGRVRVRPGNGGALAGAHVELGCCSPRVAYEEIGQSLGVLADLGDDRSVFSDNTTRIEPSAWDLWVVRALYALPPGASPDELRVVLAATAGDV